MPVKICKCGAKMAFIVVTKQDGTEGRIPLDLNSDIYEVTEFEAQTGVPCAGQRVKNTHFVNHFKTCADAHKFTRANRDK